MLRLHQSQYGNENLLLESMVQESINIYGIDCLYIPRKFVAKDEILGEDRLSTFENAYPLIGYLENAEGGLAGQGVFYQKFGLTIDQSATLVVAKKTWQESVAQYGNTVLPNRPAEADLMYIPMMKKLFEVTFVNHEEPFYQLGQGYSYKLNLELFRYSSESIVTGNTELDAFSTDLNTLIANPVEAPKSYGDNDKLKTKANTFVLDTNNIFGDL